ncbi:23S rRNA (guanosine(2251)-2'-O)-methyltransferase RlmB [[Mycoplasma] mobile]|uniref:SpoU class tRNA/rRNA methylase n=1 Tax=Mycoplasma mobile (strain ATCC 43663 / 163K / NCTC 11711) TaxID=267748 RepID=Q6KIE3_MYCM1|nr:23S rRNA (guanosine(2251)-2'-O)-methyltransferase RlmB [[Mycoplasma] mobile]AAT27633.1 spoU class tRNA/rRNA methylase [Mycoplasma mobile 163K]
MKLYLSGKNSIREAIENKVEIKKIFLINKKDYESIYKDIIVEYTNLQTLNELVKTNHQNIVAELKEFNYFSLENIIKDKADKVLILDHIQDSFNFGSILRSANAFGWNYIIIPSKRSVEINDVALKVSSGGFYNVKIIKIDSLIVAINFLKEHGFWIYGSMLDENSFEIKNAPINFPIGLIIGNEHSGLSKTMINSLDVKVKIMMSGTVQSLNAAVATGILLHDLSKKSR